MKTEIPPAKEPAPSKTSPIRRVSFLRNRHLIAIGLMLAVALVAYANTFHAPFQFDDRPNIVENPYIQIKSFSFDQLEHWIKNVYPKTIRTFAFFTFALNYYFGKFNVFGYHLVNFFIHISSGIFLYGFLLLTLNLPSLKERYGSIAFPIALFSSLLFIGHPIQTQSVTYIVQRMASMAGMFYLLGLLLYVKGRLSQGRKRLLFFAGTAVAYFLGFSSKENVVVLPLFIGLYEFYFFQNLDLSHKWKRALVYLAGFFLLIGFFAFLYLGKRAQGYQISKLYKLIYDLIISAYKDGPLTLLEQILTQFRVVLYYVTLLIYPHPSRLNLDYDFPISRGILDPPTTLLSILIVLGLIAVAFG